jgi:hypothetical protein
MVSRAPRGWLLGSVFLLGVAGCAGPVEEMRATTRVIEDADSAEIFLAAQEILEREFGRVQVDRAGGRIVTTPVEYTATTASGTARDWRRAPSTMRRVARFLMTPREGGVVARLRVDIERQDTAAREAVRTEDGRLSDSPAYTPIERDAATTAGQNVVWTHVRRDLALERSLLEELQERFAPSETAPAQTQAAY